MRMLDIDRAIEGLTSEHNNGEGLSPETDALIGELEDLYDEYGVLDGLAIENKRLQREVRRLNELMLEYEQHRVMMDNKYGELADWLIMIARKIAQRVEAEARNEAD